MTITKRIGILAGAIALLAIAVAASAQTTFVTDKTTVSWNDYIDWGYHANPDTLSTPLSTTSNGGLDVTANNDAGFYGFTEGISCYGNFSPNDNVLFDTGDGDVISLSFANPVYAAGTQIESNYYGSFTGYVTAYDSTNTVLGTYSLGRHLCRYQ
jgi:hypothetical protein